MQIDKHIFFRWHNASAALPYLYEELITVGFHNFNLRIFNLRVKSEEIDCGCLFDTMSTFNVPGSRPQKNTMKFRKSTVGLAEIRLAQNILKLAQVCLCVEVITTSPSQWLSRLCLWGLGGQVSERERNWVGTNAVTANVIAFWQRLFGVLPLT